MTRYTTKNNFYLFTNFIDNSVKKNLLKFIGINVICKDLNNKLHLESLIEIKKFCKKNKINFYIADNYKLAVKLKSNVYLYLHGIKKIILNTNLNLNSSVLLIIN